MLHFHSPVLRCVIVYSTVQKVYLPRLKKNNISISGVLPNQQIRLSSSDKPQIGALQSLKAFFCTSCPAQFYDRSELKEHMSQSHGDQLPFCCQICGKGYFSNQGLNHHMKLHEGKSFVCPICDRKMNQLGNIKRHLRNVHKSRQCPQCMKVFHLEEYDAHVQTCQHAY